MKMKRLGIVALLALLLLSAVGMTSAQDNQNITPLNPVNNSGISGAVLTQTFNGETQIFVVAFGLKEGSQYVSLYYDNHTCELEPYSADDVIGGKTYGVFKNGVGGTFGTVEDDLSQINSVSVRTGDKNLTLLACADIHPGS
jgi:hypothetical protein